MPKIREFTSTYYVIYCIPENGFRGQNQHFDAVGAVQRVGERHGISILEQMVSPFKREIVFANSCVVRVNDRQMHSDYTVGAMNGLQCHILASHVMEGHSVPSIWQFGCQNCIVQICVLVSINGDVNRCVKSTSVFIGQCERIGHRCVVDQRVRRGDDERGVVDAGDPRRIEIHLSQWGVVLTGQVLRHRHFTFENIAVVSLNAINHLNGPNTVNRTSDQTVEWHIRMVKMCSLRHVGGVYENFVKMGQRWGSVVVQNGITGIHQTSVGRGILVPFGGVVRPAIVPPDSRLVFCGVAPIDRIVV